MTNGPLPDPEIYVPPWMAIAFVVFTAYVAIDCIKYFWKLFTSNIASGVNWFRASPEDLKKLRLKFKSERAIDQHISNIMSREEGVELKRLRMCWVKWGQEHEDEFQSLLNKELLGSLTDAELARLDALTIARKMHVEEERKKP